MSKKLNGNGLFESSRFIIPQHREALTEQARHKMLRSRPELDQQELELITAAIGESYSDRTEIGLILYDDYEDKTITGVVVGVDQQLRRIKLQSDEDVYYISIKDVIGLE